MAAKIMCHHQMKQTDQTKVQNVCNWLKSAVSLVVIMCLTWVLGIFIIKLNKLAPLAYIYTIMVAFQGLFIFLIFIVFSKVVREAYIKLWKAKINNSELLSRWFGRQTHSSGMMLQANGTVSYT